MLMENLIFAIVLLTFMLGAFALFIAEHKVVFSLLIKEIVASSKANQ